MAWRLAASRQQNASSNSASAKRRSKPRISGAIERQRIARLAHGNSIAWRNAALAAASTK